MNVSAGEEFFGEDRKLKAFLVTLKDEKHSREEAGSLAGENAGLALTLGLEIVSHETVHVKENHGRYGMGTGKADELAKKAALLEADCIVFDRNLSPSQQRNWEELSGVPVIDRQELIIQIFASRARTREAELQVQMAELVYALPRLHHKYIDLSRQRGGSHGNRGSGETRFETDRRRVEQRINRLKEELEEVKRQRQVQRKLRKRQGIPVCALVGYTNSGKSSILNALTGAGVLAEDKLFATLDSTSRKLKLPQGTQVLLVDTVGFIRRLPPSLINAFQSTLEELSQADILLNVLDVSDENASEQFETTLSVLGDLGAGNIPMITVLNKIDKLGSEETSLDALVKLRTGNLSGRSEVAGRGSLPVSVPVSALKGNGLTELCERIEKMLLGNNLRFRLPTERTDLAALIHRSGNVVSEKYGTRYIEVEARVDESTAGRLKEYQINE